MRKLLMRRLLVRRLLMRKLLMRRLPVCRLLMHRLLMCRFPGGLPCPCLQNHSAQIGLQVFGTAVIDYHIGSIVLAEEGLNAGRLVGTG